MTYEVTIDGRDFQVELARGAAGFLCRVTPLGKSPAGARDFSVDAIRAERDVLSLVIAGRSYEVKRALDAGGVNIAVGSTRFAAEVRDPRSLRSRRARADATEGPKRISAPMPGKVVRLLVAEKAQVEAGQGLVVIEAMKMQNELKSPKKGVVQKILVDEGSAVNPGDTLVIVE